MPPPHGFAGEKQAGETQAAPGQSGQLGQSTARQRGSGSPIPQDPPSSDRGKPWGPAGARCFSSHPLSNFISTKPLEQGPKSQRTAPSRAQKGWDAGCSISCFAQDLEHPSWAGKGSRMGFLGSPDRLNFHVGLAELKPALGGGWASFRDIIMYKKSLALSLWGGAVSSSATWDVPGPNGTMPAFGDPKPWLGHGGGLSPLPSQPMGQGDARPLLYTRLVARSCSMAWFLSRITLSPLMGGGRAC